MEFILKENITGGESPFYTKLNVYKENGNLCFMFDCKNSKLFSAHEGLNTDLFEGDVCEAFVSIDGKRDTYVEIEVAPNNSVFCKRVYDDGNGITLFDMENIVTSFVEINGNDYKLFFSIPLEKIGAEKGILFNAYRIETEGGIRDENLLAVNPTLCRTFHKREKFIKFTE